MAQPVQCGACGAVATTSTAFCTRCGAALRWSDPPARGPAPASGHAPSWYAATVAATVALLAAALYLGWSSLRPDPPLATATGSGDVTGQPSPAAPTEPGASPAADFPAADSSAPDPPGPASPAASAPQQSPVRVLSSESRVTVPAQAPDSRDAGGRVTTYSPDHLVDGDPTTAWRMVGDGTGEYVQLSLPAPRQVVAVGLVNGYAKVDPVNGADRYAEERRITAVTWSLDGHPVIQYLDPGDRDVQTVSLDAPVTVDAVLLRIDGTTPPGDDDYDYTAISEVVVYGS